MCLRARQFVVLLASIGIIAFCTLLIACGSSSNRSTQPAATGGGNGSGSGPSGSGSGSGGSGSGSGGSGSGSSGSGSGSGSGSSSFVSYAYSADANAIHAYGVSTDGTLTAAPNSPNPQAADTYAGPKLATNGANLFTFDQSGKNIVIFPIDKSNGSLGQSSSSSVVAGDPHGASDLASAITVDHSGSSLYAQVGNGDENSGVNAFTVSNGASASQIQYLPGPAVAPSALVFAPNDQFAYADACSARADGVFGYVRASNGTLTSKDIPFPTPPTGAPGESFCPIDLAASAMNYVAIGWANFGPQSSVNDDKTYVKIYQINGDGTLAPASNSQMTTNSTTPGGFAMRFDPAGKVLAVAGNGGVQTYILAQNGTLSLDGAPRNPGTNFVNVAWDKSNHIFASTSNQLFVFGSGDNQLFEASGSPQAGGPGLVVLPLQ